MLKNFLSFFGQKVDGPGFALGGTLLGTHKVPTPHLKLTTWKRKNHLLYWSLCSPIRVRTAQELPTQLILQTRHRNAAVKSCTLNSLCNTKVATGLAAQTLSISQSLVPTWHGAPPKQTKVWTGPLKQPPNKI